MISNLIFLAQPETLNLSNEEHFRFYWQRLVSVNSMAVTVIPYKKKK